MDARAPAFGYPPSWGYFGSVAWVAIALLASAAAAYVGFVVLYRGDLERATAGTYDGVLVTISATASMPVQVAILLFAAAVKGWPLAHYFALVWPSRRDIVNSLLLLIIIMIAVEAALMLAGQEPIPEFQRDAYRTARAAGWLLPLFLAVVLFAPIAEELVFRGFLYRGFVRKPGHEPYVVVILALAFTLLHVQYDWIGLLQVFIVGLYFGWVRWSSGSTLLCILLHVFVNFAAMVETAIRVEWQ